MAALEIVWVVMDCEWKYTLLRTFPTSTTSISQPSLHCCFGFLTDQELSRAVMRNLSSQTAGDKETDQRPPHLTSVKS
ncbi:hypothetical protein SRHO_G00316570 [Serrasalmus rhombeus]